MARPLRSAADAWPRATRVSGASSGAYRPTRRDKTTLPEPGLRRLILAVPDTSTAAANGGVDSCSTVLVGMIRQTVGPAGGIIALGPARLTIPPGALSAVVTIQAKIPAGYSGNYIQFKPDGLVFQQPASLRMSYSNCSLVNATQLKVAQVTDGLQIIQYVPSTNDLGGLTVTGQLQHFSNYAVAW